MRPDAESDDNGVVWCNHCNWCAGPYHSNETIEAVIADHMKDAHKMIVTHSVRKSDGKVTTMPALNKTHNS